MIAILSDIHGNLEALEAVLDDISTFDVQSIYCLGDLIGYGPDPIPCIQHAMSWDVVLQGNFDPAGIADDELHEWTGARHAQQTILRFRDQLAHHPDRQSLRGFLALCPTRLMTDEAYFVHGSPRNHLQEYVFPEDIYNASKMDAITRLFDSLCFCGHTHIPGIFRNAGKAWSFKSPDELGHRYRITLGKTICNVGSVGQPRDGDPRSCYVLFRGDSIEFRRVEYDVNRTVQKIHEQGDDDIDGQRFHWGV